MVYTRPRLPRLSVSTESHEMIGMILSSAWLPVLGLVRTKATPVKRIRVLKRRSLGPTKSTGNIVGHPSSRRGSPSVPLVPSGFREEVHTSHSPFYSRVNAPSHYWSVFEVVFYACTSSFRSSLYYIVHLACILDSSLHPRERVKLK